MAKPSRTALDLFNSLKSDQLSRLFSLCGISGGSSATKATKSRILAQTLPRSQYFPTSHSHKSSADDDGATQRARLLSIDMGLKNLAYCVLDVELPSVNSLGTGGHRISKRLEWTISKSQDLGNDIVLPNALAHATLVGWKRVDVLAEAAKLDTQSPTASLSNLDPLDQEDQEDQNPDEDKATTDSKPSKIPNDTFEPLKLSRIALNLVQHEFLQYKPTHVVIERQRHRTGGHSSIQEWTVRVNTFEACLWAVLTTVQQQQQQQLLTGSSGDDALKKGEGVMHLASVLPKQVSRFWLEDHPLSSSSSSSSSSSKATATATSSKTPKINLASTWLSNPTSSTPNTSNPSNNPSPPLKISTPQASKTAADFLYTLNPNRSRSRSRTSRGHDHGEELEKGKEAKKLSKLDDLADCLLQGLATVQWELNRRTMVSLLSGPFGLSSVEFEGESGETSSETGGNKRKDSRRSVKTTTKILQQVHGDSTTTKVREALVKVLRL